MKIKAILEHKDVVKDLEKRSLTKQYKKAKNFILSALLKNATFKKRHPASDEIWYFRINKQFRAHCFFNNNNLIVFEIDNHQ